MDGINKPLLHDLRVSQWVCSKTYSQVTSQIMGDLLESAKFFGPFLPQGDADKNIKQQLS